MVNLASMKLPRAVIVLLHILAWVVLSFVPLYFVPLASPESEFKEIGFSAALHMGMLIFIFYFNFHFLYPAFFKKKRIFTYVVLCLITSLIFTTIYTLVRQHYHLFHASLVLFIFVKSFISLAVIALSTFSRLVYDTVSQKQRERQRETENLRTELSFLRSQVSPHFMFNVLNGLVALIRQKSDQLEPVVMELSNLLRYMLYESDEEKVSLNTEVDYLLSYVRLQLVRFSGDVAVQTDIQRNLPDKLIEPMLLIPLVENAFKHGIGMIDQPVIQVNLAYVQEELRFTVRNKFAEGFAKPREKRNSGIGLENLKKRLNLLYADHVLTIDKTGNWFTVSLHIKIKS